MPPERPRSRARLLAPIALIAFGFAIALIVIASTGGDGESGNGGESQAADRPAATQTAPGKKPQKPKGTYTVKPGDSLGAISAATGVEVEDLELLNPDVDPQALTPGQKLKLR